MSIISALNVALSGLSTAQSLISTTTQNISNAQTTGYVDEQQAAVTNVTSGGVLPGAVQRLVSDALLGQLRGSISTQSFNQTIADAMTQVDALNGDPSASTSLSAKITALGTAFQALAADPESTTTAQAVLTAANDLASSFNSQTNSILQLQTDTQASLASNVTTANADLKSIADLNQQIAAGTALGQNVSTLQDQRDQAAADLAKYMTIHTSIDSAGVMNVYSGDYKLLAARSADTLATQASNTVSKALVAGGGSGYAVGDVLTISGGTGTAATLKVTSVSASGAVTGLSIVNAGSYTSVPTSPVSVAGGSGSSATLTLNLNSSLAVTTSQGTLAAVGGTIGAQQQLVSTTLPAVLSQLDELARSITLQFGTSVGSTVPSTYNTGSAPAGTASDPSQGTGQIGIELFTGASDSYPPSSSGTPPYFSGSIQVNSTLAGNLAALRSTAASPEAGDVTAATAAAQFLTSGTATFTTLSGTNSTLTLTAAATQMITSSAQKASTSQTTATAQSSYQTQIQQSIAKTSEVNTDTELAKLVVLQNYYSANAKIVSTTKSMLDTLLSLIQ